MKLEDYKTVLYREEHGSWFLGGGDSHHLWLLCPHGYQTRALDELSKVFQMIAGEYSEKGVPLPADSTEILHA